MEAITGQPKMDAGALVEYFSTLQIWLEAENARTGEFIGWEPTTRGTYKLFFTRNIEKSPHTYKNKLRRHQAFARNVSRCEPNKVHG